MPTFFHVTPCSKWEMIKSEGLVPQLGERAKQIATEKKGVFLFTSYEDAEHALWNWLGEEFEDLDEDVFTLKVDLPKSFPLESEVGWEFISRNVIPPDCISFYKNEG